MAVAVRTAAEEALMPVWQLAVVLAVQIGGWYLASHFTETRAARREARRAVPHHPPAQQGAPMKDVQVRCILRHHRDGGPISRLYATGDLTLDGRDADADQIRDVIDYVNQVGARPAVSGWTSRR
ncbi:hypothetical protein [Streptomyces achromogenes]|uniref:hypothetical protein n=1 Tax=Streptomyces achromogenes TaxID=67255 RepID=UPI0036930FE2